MALRRFLSTTRKDRTLAPTNTSNVMTPPSHTLTGRDSVGQPGTESSLTDTLARGVVEKSTLTSPNYIYYRLYAEDGAIPSKTPIAPRDPFVGRIKVISVPPPRTAKTVKHSIAKVENIKDRKNTTLFLTPYSQSPMDDAEKVDGTGPGSTPQEPLALVAKMSDSERSALESDGRGGRASSAVPDTAAPEIQYLYYLLYADDYEIPSKVGIDPEQPSLGRIQADSVPPPQSLTSIKRCISRVEGISSLVNADLYADTSCDTPLNDSHISILRTNGPGVSPNEPMAIVQAEKVNNPSIPDGKYAIKNREKDIYWTTNSNGAVYFYLTTREYVKEHNYMQWNITRDAGGNISISTPYAPSWWVGAEINKGSKVPVPWRLISADSTCFYLIPEMNIFSQNPRVPAVQEGQSNSTYCVLGSMATLKRGDKWQMWEFIHI